MGTPANLGALAALGRRAPTARPGDVVIAVDGEDGLGDAVAGRGRSGCWPAAAAAPSDGGPAPARARWPPRLDGANVALVSVPGEYATLEAHRALTRGLHVFLFSDHVSRRRRGRAQAPRRRARPARDGPRVRHRDAGRGRPGLRQRRAPGAGRRRRRGRAPARRRSPACIDAAGSGVSHIIGVGGRDLSTAVGGTMVRQGLAMLGARRADRDAAAGGQGARGARRAGRRASPDGHARRRGARRAGTASCAGWEVHPTLEAAALAAAGARAAPLDDDGDVRRAAGARARPLLRRLAGPRGVRRARAAARRRRDRARARSTGDGHVVLDLGDRALHAGPPAPDGRPRHPRWSCSRRRPATGARRACCSTSSAATARTPTRPPSWRRRVARAAARRHGGRARVRHRRRPAGRVAPGRGAARRPARSSRRPTPRPRGWRARAIA